MNLIDASREEMVCRRSMIRIDAVHRTEDANLVDARLKMRQQFADLDTATSATLKGKGGGQQSAGDALGSQLHILRSLAGSFSNLGLGIEQIQMRRPACHEQ